MSRVKQMRKLFSEDPIKRTTDESTHDESTHDVKEATETGSSVDKDDSRPVHSLKEVKTYDKSHKEKKEEKSRVSGFLSLPKPWSKREKSPDGKHPNSSKLNLVVCGSDETLKSSISEMFLQQTDRGSKCVKRDMELHGRLISLVKIPALNRLSEDEVRRQTLRCVSLCDPGVHVFLIIVPDPPLNNEDKAEIDKIQKIFNSRKHFMLLFASDLPVRDLETDLVQSNPETLRLIKLYRDQYRVMRLNNSENSRQIPELLNYIEKMKIEPYSPQMYVKAQENRVRLETEGKYEERMKKLENENKDLKQKIPSQDQTDDPGGLRIVLIGRTGSGKSATGNTVLGREEFQSQSSSDSVTTVCEKRVGEVDGRSVAVVDTPGLFDTTLSNEKLVAEIVKCVSLSSPGPHVFVIVLSLGRFTKEETDTVDLIKKIFGPKSAQFSIVLFTRRDDLQNESIEDYVKRSNSAELKTLISNCGSRFLAFNNRENKDKSQVIQLLNMIEEVKNTNQGRCFTNSMFEEAEMSIKKKTDQILKDKEREMQNQREELQTKYEREMKDMMKRLKEERQRTDEEKMKMENQFREKEEKLRKEFEEREKTEQKVREIENQKQSEEEKQQRAEFHRKIEEMKREIENQRSQYEKQQKEREGEDRKREEKYRQEQEKMKNEQERIIAQLQMKQKEEIKKKESEEKIRNKEEEEERKRWIRKIKEAENDRKEIQEDIKQQQREWEDKKKRQMREREEEERKRKEKHEEQLREKREELEKMIKTFKRETEIERQKIEEERQKQRNEREGKEREYEEKKTKMERHFERLERERKDEWERRKQADDERQEKERKRWTKMIEDLKQVREEEKKTRETEERNRQEREEGARVEMKKKHEEEIKDMKKKYEDEARKQAEELNDFRERKEQLKEMLEDHQKQHEILEKLYQHLKEEKEKEIREQKNKKEKERRELLQEIEKLKNKKSCVVM